MKVTEQAIRDAMKLKAGVAVTLGVLDEPTRSQIAIIGSGLYVIHQRDHSVRLVLQFAAHNPSMVGYPTDVTFDLIDTDKLRKFNEAVSGFVTELQREGDNDGAARIAALITLPPEQQIKVYEALTAGESKADFLARMSAGLNLPTEAA